PAWRQLLKSTARARTIDSTGHRDKSIAADHTHPPPRNSPASPRAAASTTGRRSAPARYWPPLHRPARANPATSAAHPAPATSREWPRAAPKGAPADGPDKGLRLEA